MYKTPKIGENVITYKP